ncbi:hypothetical protein B0T10DRAFT_557120 [Thelonectria olida]|uniref:Uncharacterized protein n=1 Tax=Thelonectria olida TaxID=1576542 RepID=A0A9P8WCU6_9HYPO|nr:hypothetical protein B0T10DRAFT_557120 [Thelonectria olida]
MNAPSQYFSASSSSLRADNPNTSSTLRDRLRSRDSSTLPPSPKQPTYDALYQKLQACLDTDLHSRPAVRKRPDPPRFEDADVATQLRGKFRPRPRIQIRLLTGEESFALMGMDLHTSAMNQIIKSRSEIEQKISHFVVDSSTTLSQNNALYSNISYPLSATLCHSDNFPKASILNHLANLKKEIMSAKEELRSLGADRATNKDDTNAQQLKAEEFKSEAQEIVQNKCRLVDSIEKEFNDKLKEETIKLMKTMVDSD